MHLNKKINAQILLDDDEYRRLLTVESKYLHLIKQQSNKGFQNFKMLIWIHIYQCLFPESGLTQEGTGHHQNNSSSGLLALMQKSVQSELQKHLPSSQAEITPTPFAIENHVEAPSEPDVTYVSSPDLPQPSEEQIAAVIDQVSPRYRSKATELLKKILSNKDNKISINSVGTVFIRNDPIPNSRLSELLTATINNYRKKKVPGLLQWRHHLKEIGIIKAIEEKIEEKPVGDQIPIPVEAKKWWYIG
jgi:hypothetical protein